MTDAEMVKAMEICKDKKIPCDDCPLVERGDCEGISRQYFYDRFKQLQSENAALRDRLERAVELPFVPSDHHIEMWAAEIKESCADLSAKIVIPCYLYIKCEDKDTAVERLNELCQYTDN